MTENKSDLELAGEYLTSSTIPEGGVLALAERLKEDNKFSFARRILKKLREPDEIKKHKFTEHQEDRLREELALCTYKDRDVPADQRFRDALLLLLQKEDEASQDGKANHDDYLAHLDLEPIESIETLGQLGSILRRMWEHDLNRTNLHQAYFCYEKGYQVALDKLSSRVPTEEAAAENANARTDGGAEAAKPQEDWGELESKLAWTGINAAFVLDLLATQESDGNARLFESNGFDPAAEFLRRAKEIRRNLICRLSVISNRAFKMRADLPSNAERNLWWLLSTIGEAYYCLAEHEDSRHFERATKWFDHARDLDRPEDVERYHLESTTRRIAWLARIHDDRIRASKGDFTPRSTDSFFESRPGQVLQRFLRDDLSEAVHSTYRGKLGLALSGGGFRAAFFHLGVLSRLAELNVLRQIEVISCVSGGSVLGACYYLKLRRLLEEKADDELKHDEYVLLIKELSREFLAAVQKNVRTRIVTNPLRNIPMIFGHPNFTCTLRIARLLEKLFFKRVDHPLGGSAKMEDWGTWLRRKLRRVPDAGWIMKDLRIKPKGITRTFHPRYDNWKRANKIPMLVLNASTLNTGHNWQFTGGWMGEPPGRIDNEIDANERLRRLYLSEAPGSHGDVKLADAVAASACLPSLFEPLNFEKLYEKDELKDRIVRLVDGGVFDNQGTEALLEENCNVILISDASGQMGTLHQPGNGMLEVPLRVNDILMKRVRQAQIKELKARKMAGQLRHLFFVHLTKELDEEPVNWIGCQDQSDTPEADSRAQLTDYEFNRDVQRLIADTRTDLDSFTEVEACALMASGYQITKEYATRALPGIGKTAQSEEWMFEDLLPIVRAETTDEHLMMQLELASQRTFRFVRFMDRKVNGWLKKLSLVVAGIILCGILWYVRCTNPETWTYSGRPVVIGLLSLVMLVGFLLSFQSFRSQLPRMIIGSVLGTLGCAAAHVHLHVTDPLYQWLGRIRHFKDK